MYKCLPLAVLLSTSVFAGDPHAFSVGDGTVNGLAIGNYEATWRQCQFQEGQWTDGGTVTEAGTVIGSLLRVRQTTRRPDGVEAASTAFLDHASLAPLRLEQVVHGPDGSLLGRSQRALDEDGYHGEVHRGGEDSEVSGKLNSKQFNGAMLGLPISTLDFEHGGYVFESFMMAFDASYRVFVTLAGEETLQFEGRPVTTRMVDVEWHHDNGDIYPPGPDASGGRYWILKGEEEGIPKVLNYKTDSYAIEFIAVNCPP